MIVAKFLTKRTFISLFFLFAAINIYAQNTFSERFVFGHNNYYARAVLVTDDQIFLTGPAFGDVPYVYNGTQLVTFDYQGEIQDSFLIGPSDRRIEGKGNGFFLENDTIFFPAETYSNGRITFIGKLDIERKEYESTTYSGPQLPGGGIRFTNAYGIIPKGDELLVYGSDVDPETTVNGLNGLIITIDRNLGIVDTVHFIAEAGTTADVRCLIDYEGGFLALKTSILRQRCEPQASYSILKLNNDLEVVDQYDMPDTESWFLTSNIATDDEGNIYLQTDSLEYDNFPVGPTDCISTLRFHPRITKLNADFEREWIRNFTKPSIQAFGVTGNAGIISVPETDKLVSVSSQWNGTTRLANLVQFDTEGNKIWERTYGFFDTTENEVLTHDVDIVPGGGFVIVGEVLVPTTAENDSLGLLPRQQAWIMKVDEDGCLIPGCGDVMITGVEEREDLPDPKVLLYPNPVASTLYFYLSEVPGAQNVEGIVYDVTGRVVRRVPSRPLVPGMTYSLPVEELAAGSYFLRLGFDNGREVTKQFVKR